MLDTMRNAAKGWIAKIFLGLLVLSFAAWGIEDVFTGFRAADLVTVGSQRISSEQFRRDLNDTLQGFAQQSGSAMSLEEARQLGIDLQVLDRIINTAAVDAQAERMKLSIGDKAIAGETAANPAFRDAEGKFDATRFRSLLQRNGLTEEVYLLNEKKNKLRNTLTTIASDGARPPRSLTEAMLRYRNETRDARYFTFSVSDADVPAPSDADLKKQYELTPQAYTAPEYRSLVVMKVEPADVAAKLAVSDEEIKQGYERFKADYFTPEKRTILQLSFPDVAKADAAKSRIDAGEDFIKIAAENGAKETDITFADRTKADFLDPKIAEAAFALAEGAVSAPVSGGLATALLKAVKVTAEIQRTLEEVKPELTKRLQLDRAKDEIQSIYDAVEDARAGQTKFEDIAAKAGLPVSVIPAVSANGQAKDGSDVSVTAKNEVLKVAFGGDVGVENDAIALDDGYVWVEVREVIPSALRPLDEIKDRVRADYIAAKLRELASDKAKAMIEKAANTTKIDTLASEAGVALRTASGLKRNETSAEFDGVATLALFGAPENSLTWSLEGDGKTARIIEVSKVTVPPLATASAEAKDIADQAKAGLGSDLLETFLKSTRASTQISVNEKLWQDIRGTNAQP